MANKKKIFDITPPQRNKDSEALPPKIEIEPEKVQPIKVLKAQAGFNFKKPALILIAILLVGAFCYFFIKPEAEIEIWPVKETAEFKTQFSADGETIKQNYSDSQEFASTGKIVKEEKAEGIIRVYNNYSSDQILVATTRFWCFEEDELREFKTKEKVVIPSQKQLDVEVVASAAGEEYNIGPCTFSVPGLKGSSRYTAVYGKSSSSMTGGAKTEITIVSQEDLDKAKAIVTEKALADAKASLEKSISKEDYILVEETIEAEIIKLSPLAEVGQAVETFIFQATAEAKALVFKKSEMEEFAKSYVAGQIPQEKEMVYGSLAISYLPKTVGLKEEKITLDLEISAETYYTLDEGSIKENVKSLRLAEITSALKKFSAIDKAQARLWPFWVQVIPQNQNRIKIKLNLD